MKRTQIIDDRDRNSKIRKTDCGSVYGMDSKQKSCYKNLVDKRQTMPSSEIPMETDTDYNAVVQNKLDAVMENMVRRFRSELETTLNSYSILGHDVKKYYELLAYLQTHEMRVMHTDSSQPWGNYIS